MGWKIPQLATKLARLAFIVAFLRKAWHTQRPGTHKDILTLSMVNNELDSMQHKQSSSKKTHAQKPLAPIGRAFMAIILLCTHSVWAVPDSVSITFWNDSEPTSTMQVNHGVWQSILDRYLDDQHSSRVNRFDYSAVSDVDLVRLGDYLDHLQQFDPRQFNMAEQKAYWINLYNAKTVELVTKSVRSDDISSIRQIRSSIFRAGPWVRKRLKISQQELSLDDVEHGILRPHFNDKRLHYVLNCASIGCPNLLKTAFTADNTEELMALAEQQFLSHPRAVKMDNGRLVLSQIFEWYSVDFADSSEQLIDYLKSFQVAEVEREIDSRSGIKFDYDWLLNKP